MGGPRRRPARSATSGGGFAPRPPSFGGPPRPFDPSAPSAPRSRNFGPDAKPQRGGSAKGKKKDAERPRGPIPLKATGRSFTLDDDSPDEWLPDIDDFATSKPTRRGRRGVEPETMPHGERRESVEPDPEPPAHDVRARGVPALVRRRSTYASDSGDLITVWVPPSRAIGTLQRTTAAASMRSRRTASHPLRSSPSDDAAWPARHRRL